MQYRIQFLRTQPDGSIMMVPNSPLIGLFASVHDAATDADRRMREMRPSDTVITSYMIVDVDGKSVDPLGTPIE